MSIFKYYNFNIIKMGKKQAWVYYMLTKSNHFKAHYNNLQNNTL